VAPGSGGVGLDSLAGYRLRPDSPCRDRGLPITHPGERDFWGGALADVERKIGA